MKDHSSYCSLQQRGYATKPLGYKYVWNPYVGKQLFFFSSPDFPDLSLLSPGDSGKGGWFYELLAMKLLKLFKIGNL